MRLRWMNLEERRKEFREVAVEPLPMRLRALAIIRRRVGRCEPVS